METKPSKMIGQERLLRLSKCGLWLFLAATIVLLVTAYVVSAFFLEMNPDAAYYAGTAKQIIAGHVPYVDVALGYTSLAIYILCLPILLFGNSWGAILCFIYTIWFIDAILLALITYRYTDSKSFSVFSACLLLLYIYFSEGVYLGLESVVLLFGLLSFLVLIRSTKLWHFVLAGMFAACAFLSKQYGLGFIGICGVWILLQKDIEVADKCYSLLCLLFGFIGVLSIWIGYYILHGLEPSYLISLFLGEGYAAEGWAGILNCATWMFKRFSIIAVIPFALVCVKREKIDYSIIVSCVVGIVGFLCQCYFRSYSHYLTLVWPFAILITMYTINLVEQRYWRLAAITLLLLVACRLYPRLIRSTHQLTFRTDRWKQQELAEHLSSIVPSGSTNVYVVDMGQISSLFYNDYQPASMLEYGYGAAFNDDLYHRLSIAQTADYILCSPPQEPTTKQAVNLTGGVFDEYKVQIDSIYSTILFVRKY